MSATHGDVKPVQPITRDNPLFVFQTSNRFGSSDEGWGGKKNDPQEATRHGKEAVRVWNETLPEALKPYSQLQIEVRTRDHQTRYEMYQRALTPLEEAGIPVHFQFADPHDIYVFDPDYVEKLTQEFSCIKGYTITEINYEHYHTFNVPRYAVSPEVRYALDIVDLAVKYGQHLLIPLQSLKWMHVAADVLNRPLMDAVRKNPNIIVPINENIGPQYLQRMTSTLGIWLSGATAHWGVEPQSWWFENGRMITPGVFGQFQADNTRIMPADLYRPMIRHAAMLGATVYDFEPFWDLFDYDNAKCWNEVIAPELIQLVEKKLISSKEQVLEKMKVAYQYQYAADINEFHINSHDIDWIHDKGIMSRAAYGLWDRFMEHELIPNKDRYFFIPLLPPDTPEEELKHYDLVMRPGHCKSEEEYEALFNEHYKTRDGEGTATIHTINGFTHVMQNHENLYERQTWAIEVPRPIEGLKAELTGDGIKLGWTADPGAEEYHVRRWERTEPLHPMDEPPIIATVKGNDYLDKETKRGPVTYTVTAKTSTRHKREGTVNYLDFYLFSQTESVPGEQLTFEKDTAQHQVVEFPPDTRPASQVVHPIYKGAEEAENRKIAEQIVERIDQFKQHYDDMDWRALCELYSADYRDPSGWGKEYVTRAWMWWFFRMNTTCWVRQIREWDFSELATAGKVKVTIACLCRGLRRDDRPFGGKWDGTCRIPRTLDELVVFHWKTDEDGKWRIVSTDPAVPNFNEMLWLSRGGDKQNIKLIPGVDNDTFEELPEGLTNPYQHEFDWFSIFDKERQEKKKQ